VIMQQHSAVLKSRRCIKGGKTGENYLEILEKRVPDSETGKQHGMPLNLEGGGVSGGHVVREDRVTEEGGAAVIAVSARGKAEST